MAKRELKAVSYVTIDGNPVLWESLSSKDQERCVEKIMSNLSSVMSEYFSDNPEEAKCLIPVEEV